MTAENMKSKNLTNQITQDYLCLVCGEEFDLQMVQFRECTGWAHEECEDRSNEVSGLDLILF
jgi:hypothetical protein